MLKLVERDTRLQGGDVKSSEENIFPSLIINVFPIRVISLDKLPSYTTFPTFPQLSSSPDALTHACIDRNLTALHPFDPWLRSSHRFEPTIAPFAAIPSFSPLRLKVLKKEKRKKGEGERRTNRATMEESLNREVKTTKLARTALLSQTF